MFSNTCCVYKTASFGPSRGQVAHQTLYPALLNQEPHAACGRGGCQGGERERILLESLSFCILLSAARLLPSTSSPSVKLNSHTGCPRTHAPPSVTCSLVHRCCVYLLLSVFSSFLQLCVTGLIRKSWASPVGKKRERGGLEKESRSRVAQRTVS